jgi:hypothetical protein
MVARSRGLEKGNYWRGFYSCEGKICFLLDNRRHFALVLDHHLISKISQNFGARRSFDYDLRSEQRLDPQQRRTLAIPKFRFSKCSTGH